MTVIEVLFWGAFGGLAVEAIDLLRATKRVKTLPWRAEGEPGLGAIAFSVVLRVVIGGGLAIGLGSAEQISGPMGAFAVGICAPLIISQIGTGMPAAEAAEAAGNPSALVQANAEASGNV